MTNKDKELLYHNVKNQLYFLHYRFKLISHIQKEDLHHIIYMKLVNEIERKDNLQDVYKNISVILRRRTIDYIRETYGRSLTANKAIQGTSIESLESLGNSTTIIKYKDFTDRIVEKDLVIKMDKFVKSNFNEFPYELFKLYYISYLSRAEIAKITNKSRSYISTIKNRIDRQLLKTFGATK